MAIGKRPPRIPCYIGLSIGQLTTWQLASSEQAHTWGAEREREIADRSQSLFVTYLEISLGPAHTKGRGLHRVRIPGSESLGAILEATAIVLNQATKGWCAPLVQIWRHVGRKGDEYGKVDHFYGCWDQGLLQRV